MQDSQRIIQLHATASALGFARQEYAVVSPCSGCRAFTAGDGSGVKCPRRYWMEAAKAGAEVHPVLLQRNSARLRQQLYRTSPGDPLENPVYSAELGVVVVWVAALRDNTAVTDPVSGRLLAPDLALLAGSPAVWSYPTEHIRCRLLPYLPGQPSRGFSDLLFREWETVVLEGFEVDNRAPGEDRPPLAGHVRRAQLAFQAELLPPGRSVNPSGY